MDPVETMKDPSPSLLTPRERQIVTLLLEGCTDKTMAARLGISDQTVKNQLSTLCQKVGVGSRLELVLVAMRSNLA
jgi:DNA-binding NarL/FixJ family response regulator